MSLDRKKHQLVLYGLDADGKLCHAENALIKESYNCPYCNARLHLTHRGEKLFYACYANERHTHAECRSGKAILRDLSITKPDDFFQGLLAEGHKRASKNQRKVGRASAPIEGVFPCTSLRHIYETGLHLHAPREGVVGNRVAAEIIITPDLVQQVINDSASLNERVVYALPDWVNYRERTIRFVLLRATTKKRGKYTQRKYFIILFGDKFEDFFEFRHALFDAGGRALPCRVLVAANWQAVSAPDCANFCGKSSCSGDNWVCKGMQIGEFHNKKQIYSIPRTAEKKDTND